MKHRNIGLRDIALKADVSIATVSLVLSGRGNISVKTRKRISALAEEMGYVPNLFGKALNRKKCGVIGIIVPIANSHLFQTLIAGIGEEAELKGKSIFASFSRDSSDIERRMIKIYSQIRVDGIIIAPVPSDTNVTILNAIAADGIPIVQVERFQQEIKGDYVGSDNWTAAYKNTVRLIQKGAKEIGCVVHSFSYSTTDEYLYGYKAALGDHGIAFREEWIMRIPAGNDPSAYAFIREAVSKETFPKNFLWCISHIAEFNQLLRELRLVNGENMNAVLFNADTGISQIDQSISNVVQDGMKIGREAVKMLYKNDNENESTPPVETDFQRMELRLPCMQTIISGTRFEDI